MDPRSPEQFPPQDLLPLSLEYGLPDPPRPWWQGTWFDWLGSIVLAALLFFALAFAVFLAANIFH